MWLLPLSDGRFRRTRNKPKSSQSQSVLFLNIGGDRDPYFITESGVRRESLKCQTFFFNTFVLTYSLLRPVPMEDFSVVHSGFDTHVSSNRGCRPKDTTVCAVRP